MTCYLQTKLPKRSQSQKRNSPRGFLALAQAMTASDSPAILLNGLVDALGNPVARQADLSRRRKAEDKSLTEPYLAPNYLR